MDEWSVGIAISGLQQGFMLMPCVAIDGVSQNALEAIQEAAYHRCFFDFRDMGNTNAKSGYPYTPPMQLLPGLRAEPKLYSDSVSTIFAPKGFDADELVRHAFDASDVSYRAGLGELAGLVFRIGHLGSLSGGRICQVLLLLDWQ